jgi:hypothetical protein
LAGQPLGSPPCLSRSFDVSCAPRVNSAAIAAVSSPLLQPAPGALQDLQPNGAHVRLRHEGGRCEGQPVGNTCRRTIPAV